VASGVINAAGETVAARLAVIFRGLRAAIEKYRPEAAAVAAVESVWRGSHRRGAGQHQLRRMAERAKAGVSGQRVGSDERRGVSGGRDVGQFR
jgi:hypothetical protein